MLLQFPPEIQALAHILMDDKPPPGYRYWRPVPCKYVAYNGSSIRSQGVTGDYFRLLRIHVHMAQAGRLVAVVKQPTVAIGFLHLGMAQGRLSGVADAIEFREGHYYIPLLLPGDNQDSVLELEAGDYEVTVILIEKKFEAAFLKMFAQLAGDIEKILSRNSSGLTFPPYPITPAMDDLLRPVIRYRGSADELITAVSFAVSGLILAIKQRQDEHDALGAEGDRIKLYLVCHLGESHTAASVAGALKMKRKHLFEKVRQCFGKTFKELLIGVRMERARHLLGDNSWMIATIAEAVGYKNCGHFSDAFLKHEGMRPLAYRKKINEARFDKNPGTIS